jgi:hypothetical protein
METDNGTDTAFLRNAKRRSHVAGETGTNRANRPSQDQAPLETQQVLASGGAQQRRLGQGSEQGQRRISFGRLKLKGSQKKEPIRLTPEILLILDRLEPDKGRQANLLTEHIAEKRVLPSTEEELLQQLEHKAKREFERQQAAEERPSTWQHWINRQ